MSKKVDIARALKDKEYFNSLSEEDQARVRAASPVGAAGVSDDELESVSGGLEGGVTALATTTTTEGSCECPAAKEASSDLTEQEGACVCTC